tara:strand:- start:472 stop:645 length:174 start_codon:yes stop_codon:yes gene_type:complete
MKTINEEQLEEAIKLVESIRILTHEKAHDDTFIAQIHKSAYLAEKILKEKLGVETTS